jgi:hypothetical protein
MLLGGMVWILMRHRQWIPEYRHRFVERDPMLPPILGRFAWVPLKIHPYVLPYRIALRILENPFCAL